MNTRNVEGTDYKVRPITAREMMDLDTQGFDGIAGLVKLAYFATVKPDGTRQWATEEEAENAPWPTIKACADAALIVNGLTDEGDAGN